VCTRLVTGLPSAAFADSKWSVDGTNSRILWETASNVGSYLLNMATRYISWKREWLRSLFARLSAIHSQQWQLLRMWP
jgi:hypothetical protein